MTSPWLLVVAGGITVGALFGPAGIALWALATAVAAIPGRRRALLVGIALLAATTGAIRVAVVGDTPMPDSVVASARAEVVVRSIPQNGPSGPRAVVRVERAGSGDGELAPVGGDVLVFFRDHAPEDLARGDRLRITWSVTPMDELDDGFSQFVRSTGAGGMASAFQVTVLARGNDPLGAMSRFRDLVTDRIVAAIPGDAGALIAGFVTGDDSRLTDATRDAFERTNMSHITAVSGSNVAVLLTIWLLVLPTGRLRRSSVALIAIALTIWAYVVLVGMSPGAVRAGLFSTIALPAARFGRRPDPMTALLLASALMLLVEPRHADSAGFWLSLAASAAMVTCVQRRTSGRFRILASGLIALVAAQVATLPLTVWIFGGWSPASLVANLLVGPIVSVFFPFAFFVALIVTGMPWVGGLVGWAPAIVADVIIAIVRSLADDASLARVGFMPAAGVALLAALSLAALAAMSVDTRRWLRRMAWRWPARRGVVPAVAIGAAAGAWVAVLVMQVVG